MSNDGQSGVMFHTQRGKWGMASFTSTRAIGKIPGQKSYAPPQNTSYTYEHEVSSQAAVPSIAASAAPEATTPKPRKFFKSRTAAASAQAASAAAQDVPQQQQQQSYYQQESYTQQVAVAAPHPAAKPAKTKHSKKKSTAIQEYFVPPAAEIPTPTPPPPTLHHVEPELIVPQPSVSQDRIRETIPSKRYLARARKVQVNYNEDENSLPPPPAPPVMHHHPPVIPVMTVPISAVSPSLEHQPPIKLRISKGTSRLISTDSEEANNASPPHQAFAVHHPTVIAPTPTSVAVAAANGIKEGVGKAVKAKVQKSPATRKVNRASPRKRRTPAAAAAAELAGDSANTSADGEPRRTTRAKRRQQEEEELRSEQEQTACEEEVSSVGVVPPVRRPETPPGQVESVESVREFLAQTDPAREVNKRELEVERVPEAPVVEQKPPPARRGRKPKAAAAAAAAPVPVVAPRAATPPPPATPEKQERQKKKAVEMGTPKKQKIAEPESPSPRRSTRGATGQGTTPIKQQDEEPKVATVASPVAKSPTIVKSAAPARSYGRKRKGAAPVTEIANEPVQEAAAAVTESAIPAPTRGRKGMNNREQENQKEEMATAVATAAVVEEDDKQEDPDDKPLVKLVISKKKGSIFKSRALVSDEEVAKNRPVYKHKWDVADEDRNSSPKGASPGGDLLAADGGKSTKSASSAAFDGDFDEADGGSTAAVSATTKPPAIFKPHRRALLESSSGNNNHQHTYGGVQAANASSSASAAGAAASGGIAREPRNAFYTVKQAHQIQEIGEFQEMHDDVEYILDTLQPKYPILTRCLSAMQLSAKCMTPDFRMHVRAHGTVTQFFRVLKDAPRDRSLGLCTAMIMFVLSQDNIGMDLDKDSLELMLNLLECDETRTVAGSAGSNDDVGLTEQQAARNKMKVRELCEEVKSQGKAPHLNLDNITVSALATETLLSLTSQRAGEWIKEELRTLGGLEHIVKTICEDCRQISDYVAVWTEGLLERLRRIERCLRVLDNVMDVNEQNQRYILTYDKGNAINVLVKLYKLCDTEIALYPTTVGTPKDDPGVVIREALMPTVKVLVSLTHPFNEEAIGARIVGEKAGVFDTSLHLLFHSSNYVPEDVVFELSVLVELLLLNLTMHTTVNRTQIMEANALSDFGSQFAKVPAIKALVEFFYKCEEAARLAEQNADEILDAKPKKKSRRGDEMEETVTKVVQTAGNHMEQTVMAGYVGLLMGQLVMNNDGHRRRISEFLRPGNGFGLMAKILEKYYNFMLLTATSTQSSVEHVQTTKKIMDYLAKCDEM